MKTKNIQQTVTFNATAKEVYEALVDAKKHSAFTGAAARIDKKLNGKFSSYDGYCTGYTMELIEDKKIVQAWHFEEEGWPEDHYSICTFDLVQSGNKTKLTFKQTGIPEHKASALASGWKEFYWEPLKAFLI